MGAAGYLKASLLNEDGSTVPGFAEGDSRAVTGDVRRGGIAWTNAADLSRFKDRHIRIAFHLRNAKLYSFWIE